MFIEFLTQNLLWVVAFIAVFSLLIFSIASSKLSGAKMLSALHLPQLQRDGNAVIIDVRDSKEYKAGHIPDAINVSIKELTEDNQAINKHKEKAVIIVCQTGSRSVQASKTLRSLGFTNLYILTGGMINWNKENLPTKQI